MRLTLALCATLLVMTVVAPVSSQAKDLCIRDSTDTTVLVLRKVKLPKAGSCNPVAGNGTGQIFVLSGAACESTDGMRLEVHFTARNNFLDSFENILILPTPAMTGGSYCSKANNTTSGSCTSGYSAVVCKDIPVL